MLQKIRLAFARRRFNRSCRHGVEILQGKRKGLDARTENEKLTRWVEKHAK